MSAETNTPSPEVPVVPDSTKLNLSDLKEKVKDKDFFALVKDFMKNYKTMTPAEKAGGIAMMLLALTEGDKKKDGEKDASGRPAPTQAKAAGSNPSPAAPEEKAPEKKAPTTEIGKFLEDKFPAYQIEVLGNPKPLGHTIILKKSKPGWDKKRTDNWDYLKAGNTDKEMEEGNYHIDAVDKVEGYSRQVSRVPKETADKISEIAVALRTSPLLSLFDGFELMVDGIKICMFKEIHINPDSTSRALNGPHTGIAFMVA